MAEHGFGPAESIAPDALGAVSIAVGDLSGDSRDDLIVLATGDSQDPNYRVLLYVQTAAGNLAPPIAFAYGAELGARVKPVDFDSDGDQDIVVSQPDGWSVLQNEGELQFSLSTHPASGVAASDFDFMDVDLDGYLDIVASSDFEGSAVYFGDGNCGIRESIALSIPGGDRLHLLDMNRDGKRDIAYTRIYEQDLFIHPYENGGFSSEHTTVLLGSGRSYLDDVLISDLDDDGVPEIAVELSGYPTSNIVLYRQLAHGSYRKAKILRSALNFGGTLAAADLDGDGRQDLVQTGTSSDAIGVNFGSAGLTAQAMFPVDGLNALSASAIGDLNGDGLQDIVVRGVFGAVSYLPGRVLPMQPDPGIYLGLAPSAVVVRVDNHSASIASESYEFTLELDMRFGSVNAASVPEGCHDPGWSDTGVYLMCAFEGLPAGASRTVTVPIAIPPRATMNRLSAYTRMLTWGPDLRPENNTAQKSILIPPADKRKKR